MFAFLSQLSESRLFPTVKSLERVTDKQVTEWTFMYLCALRILLLEEGSHDWGRVYARNTARYGNFDKWRNDGTDLYVLLHCNKATTSDKVWLGNGLNRVNVLRWLRAAARNEPEESLTRRLFVKLDFDLQVHSSALRAVRRLVMDWPHIDIEAKRLCMTRLIFYFHTYMRRSEILIHLERLASAHNLKLHDVENPDGATYT